LWKISLFFTLVLLVWSFGINAQIFSPNADYKIGAIYVTDTTKLDTIFIFNNPDGNGKEVLGSLTVISADTATSWDFVWSKYNPISNMFDSILFESSTDFSTIDSLEEGGYQVRISNGIDVDTIFRAWVFINHVSNLIDIVRIKNYICYNLTLEGILKPDTLIYYDLIDFSEITFVNGVSLNWTSEPPSFIPYPYNLQTKITFPPVVDTKYYLTVTDSSGYKKIDSVFFVTSEVKAEFEIAIKDEIEEFKITDNPEGQAPLEVKFINTSENGVEFQWFYGDSTVEGFEEPEFTFNVSDEPEYTYLIPNTYYITLIAKSADRCEDIFPDPNSPDEIRRVKVYYSKLEVPNIFTPNDDDRNDIFKVEGVSLKNFHGVILNRWGRKVFEWSDPEKGWDGKIHGDNLAAPGVYFYVITGRGWDNEAYKFQGSIYLVREKKFN